MSKYENEKMNKTIGYYGEWNIKKRTPIEESADNLVWAIECVIDDPRNIKTWFLVKDAIEKYKKVRRG